MAWDLNINPDIRESKSLKGPNLIAIKIQSEIKQACPKKGNTNQKPSHGKNITKYKKITVPGKATPKGSQDN